jgi:predicted cupin superfamily sugar epimerase
MNADEVIATLGLAPHPRGRLVRRDPPRPRPARRRRGAVTAIHFLLRAGERSRWHRVDATEIWLWHAGAPLRLGVSPDGREVVHTLLGPDLAAATAAGGGAQGRLAGGGEPGRWTLVSCVVAPAFEFAGFEMAAEGYEPG